MKQNYAIVSSFLLLGITPQLEAKENPNIILIVTDQQSYNTISALSDVYPGSYSITPNIDRLVKEGVSFTNAYCANPVSVPSRFSLYTGKYGGQYSIRENRCAQAKENTTRSIISTYGMGNIFRGNGYETVYGGKVHLPFAAKKGGSKFAAPLAYGFETYLTKDERSVLAESAALFLEERSEDGKPFLLVTNFLNPHDICIESSTNLSKEVKQDPKKPEKAATIKRLRDQMASIDSIEFYAKHAPALPSNLALTTGYPNTRCKKNRVENFPDYYWRKYRWMYKELVSIVDNHVGEILSALDRNPAIKENTIIIFTSDHGEMQGAHHMTTKSVPFDECQRIPFIIAGKGIPQNMRIDELICNGVDLLPTMCDLSNISVPNGLDGLSLKPLLKGNKNSFKRDHLYTEAQTFVNIIQDGYKYTLFDLDKGQEILINLEKDPGEMKNLLDGSKKHRQIADKLRKLIPLK